MTTRISLFLVAVTCLVAAGCQVQEPSSPDNETTAAPTEKPHTNDDPTPTTVSGRLSGYDCAVVGELCPTTHRGTDYTTGVYTKDGTFYFVVNIPQSFLTQYFLETVEVEGRVYPPYDHAVEPEVIHLVADGQRRPIYKAGYFIDEEGQRATFNDGEFRNGRWRVP